MRVCISTTSPMPGLPTSSPTKSPTTSPTSVSHIVIFPEGVERGDFTPFGKIRRRRRISPKGGEGDSPLCRSGIGGGGGVGKGGNPQRGDSPLSQSGKRGDFGEWFVGLGGKGCNKWVESPPRKRAAIGYGHFAGAFSAAGPGDSSAASAGVFSAAGPGNASAAGMGNPSAAGAGISSAADLGNVRVAGPGNLSATGPENSRGSVASAWQIPAPQAGNIPAQQARKIPGQFPATWMMLLS